MHVFSSRSCATFLLTVLELRTFDLLLNKEATLGVRGVFLGIVG